MPNTAEIVLEKDLLSVFFDFCYNSKYVDIETVRNLFQHIKVFYITDQLLAELIEDKELLQILQSTYDPKKMPWIIFQDTRPNIIKKEINEQGQEVEISTPPPFDNALLEEMVNASLYKICLSKNNKPHKNYRIVDITSSSFQPNFSEKIGESVSRQLLHSHIQHITRDAQKIEIHDKYAYKKNTLQKMATLLSLGNCSNCEIHIFTISYNDYSKVERHPNKRKFNHYRTRTQNYFANFKSVTIHDYDSQKMHDRYIKIDDEIEILISSGFEYIFNTKKECTYIISKIK